MKRSLMTTPGLLIMLSLLAGCAGLRGAQQPELSLPDRFISTDETGIPAEDKWWPAWGDSTLNRLMDRAFAENLSLKMAVARLQQFRAGRKATNSNLFPILSLQGSYTQSDEVEKSEMKPFELQSLSRFSATLTASYELDLWGKLAASRGAAAADQFASEEDLRALVLTMAANVARTYYLVVEHQLQHDLLERTISSYEDSYELVFARYTSGVAPSLDVYQAETNLAGARAQKALIEASLAAAEHALSVLLAEYPRHGLIPPTSTLPGETTSIPPGLPSRLVQRRPDVRASYWRLMAADRRAATAVAERLPNLTLTGSISDRSDELSDLLDPEGMIWRAVGNIVLPVFEAGRRKANADRAQASWRESLAGYKLTVLTGLQEVEDALARGRKQEEYLEQLNIQVRAAEGSLRLATDRYLRGVSEYLQVVVAQTAYLNLRRNQISARRALVDLQIGLATALGGGWTDVVIEEKMNLRGLRKEG